MTANVLAYKLAVFNVKGTTRAEVNQFNFLVLCVQIMLFFYPLGPPVQHVCGQTCSKTGQGK